MSTYCIGLYTAGTSIPKWLMRGTLQEISRRLCGEPLNSRKSILAKLNGENDRWNADYYEFI